MMRERNKNLAYHLYISLLFEVHHDRKTPLASFIPVKIKIIDILVDIFIILFKLTFFDTPRLWKRKHTKEKY